MLPRLGARSSALFSRLYFFILILCNGFPQMIPDIVTIALMVTATAAGPKEWPNPEQDPLVFVANPVEAEMPGHWVPLSIVKVILERPSTTTPKPTWPRSLSTRKPTKKAPKPEPLKDPSTEEGTKEETKDETKEESKEKTKEESKEKTKEESKEKTKEESKEKTKEEEPEEEPAEDPEPEEEEDPPEDPPADPPKGPKKRQKKAQDGQLNLNVKKR